MTVREALALPSLRHGAPRVVAGVESLERQIRWAHSGEVSNIASLLRGGELLLTTGMGVGRTGGEQRRFVQNLAERAVAGIVVELGQVFTKLPAALVEEALAHRLPLIELHREVRFVHVTEEIHSRIVGRQLALLRRGDELHGVFTGLLLDGAGVPEILAELSSAVANPVVLARSDASVLYHVPYRAPSEEVLARFESLGRYLSSEEVTDSAIVRGVPGAAHRDPGSLVVLAHDTPIDEYDVVAVERAVPLVALALMRVHQESIVASRERGNFLADLALGKLSAGDALVRARSLGFTASRGLVLPLAITRAQGPSALAGGVDYEQSWTPIWAALRQELESAGTPAIVGSRAGEGRTLILLGLRHGAERAAAVNRVVGFLEGAARRQLGALRGPIVVAGAALSEWDEVAAALRLVSELAECVRDDLSRRWYDAAAPDITLMVHRLRRDPTFVEFCERLLDPVLEHDRQHAHKLLPTLYALSTNGWNMTKTADALYLNRRSLYPRIERLQRTLDCDLSNVDARLAIDLALRIHDGRTLESPVTARAAHDKFVRQTESCDEPPSVASLAGHRIRSRQ